MRISTLATIPLSALLVFTACSSDDGGGGTTGPTVSQDQFVTAAAGAICDNIGACCQTGGFTYDAAQCRQGQIEWLTELYGQTTATYDAAAAGACVQQLETAARNCEEGPTDACARVFKGSKAVGEACEGDFDCAPVAGAAVTCERISDSELECQAIPRGKPGDPCVGNCTFIEGFVSCYDGDSESGEGYCFEDDGLICREGACAPIPEIGEPCSYWDCKPGAYCSSETETCVVAGGVGDPCEWDEHCAETAYCGADGLCAAKKADGEACEHGECVNDCGNGVCGKVGLASDMTCSGSNPY